VLAYDEDTDSTGEYEVSAVHIHEDSTIVEVTINGEVIETTPEHPFYTLEDEWVAAEDLRVGDHIRQADGTYGLVEAIETYAQPQPMYNLTVEEAHTFFVGEGQWLVHNTCSGRVLLIGEGDFSFARSLIETGQVKPEDLVATSYQQLNEIPDAAENIEWLIKQGVDIRHGVDARKLDDMPELGEFDTIRWNFPHDGKSIAGANARHTELFTAFMKSALPRLKENGRIELTLYDTPYYKGFGYMKAAKDNGLKHYGSVKFDFANHPGYRHRYTNSTDSKGVHPALVHIFGRPTE
jgi:hypothetical protein